MFEVLFVFIISVRKPSPEYFQNYMIYLSKITVCFIIQVLDLTIPVLQLIGRMLTMEHSLVKNFFMFQVPRDFN
jgi:hypothetical protein